MSSPPKIITGDFICFINRSLILFTRLIYALIARKTVPSYKLKSSTWKLKINRTVQRLLASRECSFP